MSSTPPVRQPFESLVSRELGAPAGRGDRWLTDSSRDLAGIALSGGGIRSATFNLGVLQALERLGIVGAFDYLSTVSGGGYVGGFWTRWRSRGGGRALFPAADEETGAEAPPVRHLREFSNFLTPRLGLLTVDTGRAVVAVVSAIVPSLAAALSVIVLALLAWAFGTRLLFPPAGADGSVAAAAMWGAVAAAAAATFVGLAGAEWLTPRDIRRSAPRAYRLAVAFSVAAVAGAWWWVIGSGALAYFWLPGQRLPLVSPGVGAGAWFLLFLPSATLAAGAGVLLALRVLSSRWSDVPRMQAPRAALDRAQSRLWLFAAVWAVVSVVWCAGVWAAGRAGENAELPAMGPLAAAAAALAAVFARVQKALAGPAKPAGGLMTRLRPLLPQLLAYTVLGLMVVALAGVLVRAGNPVGPAGWAVTEREAEAWAAAAARLDAVLAAALVVTLLALLFFNPNEVGLHAFYKGRLVRAYLGASGEPRNRSTGDVEDDDEFLHLLPDRDRPFHLVCCAANDLSAAAELDNLHRGAESAVLSRAGLSVGGDWARWDPRRRVPTLGAAMTASGAAFNSLMGAQSLRFGPAVRFLMAALGLRLGLWVPHPRRLAERGVERARRLYVKDLHLFRASRWGRARSALRRAARVAWSRAGHVFAGVPFYRELFGIARAGGRTVHLSDGAHFENLGIYELIRRHCRYILASDCGADPTVSFDDFGNLVRKVRQDFGVDVRIDLSPLRPGPDGMARQYMVAGDIHYPNGDTGVLLLFKPTLVGGEPADVLQYRTRNPVFPHETTGDQFYDEAQWESYRRLGEHAALTAFGRITGGLGDAPGEGEQRARLFARARFEWLPAPAGYAERASGISERMAALDEMLRQEHCRGLLRQVYRELPDPPAAPPPAGETPAHAAARDALVLVTSLDAVRRALRMMEETFYAEELERTSSHPVYLGLLNYFARWANAPLLRAWWPVLRTQHAAPFTRFLEAQYGLAAAADAQARVSAAFDVAGYAATCWENQRGAPANAGGAPVLSYELKVAGRWLQVGLLPIDASARRNAWESRDFYVPPGLWGCGLGADFLRRLVNGEPADGAAPGWLMVRVAAGRRPSARRRMADDMQMYRVAGFREVTLGRDGALLVDGQALDGLNLNDVPAQWVPQPGRWMVAARALPASDAPAPWAAAAGAAK